MSPSQARRADLLTTVDAAQQAAGVLAARHRGDPAGAATLMAGVSERDLAAGSLLLAELAFGLYARESGQDVSACIQSLCVDLENAVRGA